jgi:hypothetical protein
VVTRLTKSRIAFFAGPSFQSDKQGFGLAVWPKAKWLVCEVAQVKPIAFWQKWRRLSMV